VAELAVTVNAHLHTLTCDDGQEARLRRLAQQVDARVAEFVATVGQVGEARLLLLAALTFADQLSDAAEAAQIEKNRGEAALAGAADGVDALAARLEAIAARLEAA
jgi:cell division protein ZapA